jgi:hypothetical protein
VLVHIQKEKIAQELRFDIFVTVETSPKISSAIKRTKFIDADFEVNVLEERNLSMREFLILISEKIGMNPKILCIQNDENC